VQKLLDAVVAYLPAPADMPPVKGTNPKSLENEERKASDDEPFAALAFKIMTDPYVGKLTFFRVYSGKIKAGSYIYNAKGTGRASGPHRRDARQQAREREEVYCGEIAAAVGLKHVHTGDTLCDKENRSVLEAMHFPEPVIQVAIEPKTKSDEERMATALAKLSDEDPTFRVKTDEDSGQTLISGMGELHLEILVDRMVREFNVAANIASPGRVQGDDLPARRAAHTVRPPDGRTRPVRGRLDHAGADAAGRRVRLGQRDPGRLESRGSTSRRQGHLDVPRGTRHDSVLHGFEDARSTEGCTPAGSSRPGSRLSRRTRRPAASAPA